MSAQFTSSSRRPSATMASSQDSQASHDSHDLSGSSPVSPSPASDVTDDLDSFQDLKNPFPLALCPEPLEGFHDLINPYSVTQFPVPGVTEDWAAALTINPEVLANYELAQSVSDLPPQPPPKVVVRPNKTKIRAETLIHLTLIMDNLDNLGYLKLPRKLLAKPKLFTPEDRSRQIEETSDVVEMTVHLLTAACLQDQKIRATALRRAATTEPMPRRPVDISVADLKKDDEAHPQNGGEVRICIGCKKRESTRYSRKKKACPNEAEWNTYEDDHVVMFNQPEHLEFRDMTESGWSPLARCVEFDMRIACYCRHQEQKSPQGYRAIFTFRRAGTVINQTISDVFHITDDHKNKSPSPKLKPPNPPLQFPPQMSDLALHSYESTPLETSFVPRRHSQPISHKMVHATPPVAQPMPLNTSYTMAQPVLQSSTLQPIPQSSSYAMAHPVSQSPHSQSMPKSIPMIDTMTLAMPQQGSVYPTPGPATAPAYPGHSHNGYHDTPMASPTSQIAPNGPPAYAWPTQNGLYDCPMTSPTSQMVFGDTPAPHVPPFMHGGLSTATAATQDLLNVSTTDEGINPLWMPGQECYNTPQSQVDYSATHLPRSLSLDSFAHYPTIEESDRAFWGLSLHCSAPPSTKGSSTQRSSTRSSIQSSSQSSTQGTPDNLSRQASPTWMQGPGFGKRRRHN